MSDKNEESQLILRVPDDLADKINSMIDSEGQNSGDLLELKPSIIKNSKGEEVTQFSFEFGDYKSKASILELPCIIESHKTIDDINIFKSGNIS